MKSPNSRRTFNTQRAKVLTGQYAGRIGKVISTREYYEDYGYFKSYTIELADWTVLELSEDDVCLIYPED